MECKDRTAGVCYPRHDEYTGRGYCVRCGATTDAALHAAYRREEARREADRRRLEEADQDFMAGRIGVHEYAARTSRRG
jgi:hypothetical protein